MSKEIEGYQDYSTIILSAVQQMVEKASGAPDCMVVLMIGRGEDIAVTSNLEQGIVPPEFLRAVADRVERSMKAAGDTRTAEKGLDTSVIILPPHMRRQ